MKCTNTTQSNWLSSRTAEKDMCIRVGHKLNITRGLKLFKRGWIWIWVILIKCWVWKTGGHYTVPEGVRRDLTIQHWPLPFWESQREQQKYKVTPEEELKRQNFSLEKEGPRVDGITPVFPRAEDFFLGTDGHCSPYRKEQGQRETCSVSTKINENVSNH